MLFTLFYFGTGLLLALPCIIMMLKYYETEDQAKATLNTAMMTAFMIALWPLVVPYIVYLWFEHRGAYNPVQQMWLAPDNQGYWLVDRRGNKHAFGSAIHHSTKKHKSYDYKPDELSINPSGRILCAAATTYFGDVFGQSLLAPIVAVLPNEQREGYYIYTQAGEVFAFGAVEHHGSLAEVDPTQYSITWRGYRVKMSQLHQANAATTPAEQAAKSAGVTTSATMA